MKQAQIWISVWDRDVVVATVGLAIPDEMRLIGWYYEGRKAYLGW